MNEIPVGRIVEVADRKMWQEPKTLHVGWQIDRFCNYSCSYCFPASHSSKRNGLPTKALLAGHDALKKQAREVGVTGFALALLGGEATLHPGFMDLIVRYAEDTGNWDYQSLVLVTNLSNGPRWWEKFAAATVPLDFVTVSASWHPDQAKDRVSFADKLISMAGLGVRTKATIVMEPQYFDALYDDALYFASRGLDVVQRVMRIAGNKPAPGYDDDMKKRMAESFQSKTFTHTRNGRSTGPLPDHEPGHEMSMRLRDDRGETWFLDNPDRLVPLGLNRFGGWKCAAGRQSIVIDERGVVRRGYACWDQPLGTLSNGFSLHHEPQVCVTRTCGCSGDLMVPKTRS